MENKQVFSIAKIFKFSSPKGFTKIMSTSRRFIVLLLLLIDISNGLDEDSIDTNIVLNNVLQPILPPTINADKEEDTTSLKKTCEKHISSLAEDTVWYKYNVSETKTNIDFHFKTFRKYNSVQVEHLLRGKKLFFLGNSMLDRLIQSVVILRQCCPTHHPWASNNQRHWYDKRTTEPHYGHGSFYYILNNESKSFDLKNYEGEASNYLTQSLKDFDSIPIHQCPAREPVDKLKEYNDNPLPVEYVFSVDCKFVPNDFDHKEDTLLLYKYTNTPVYHLEEWLLPKLANPVPENRKESEGSYKYLQDNIDIFVVQSPTKDEDFYRIVKMLTDMLKYVVLGLFLFFPHS